MTANRRIFLNIIATYGRSMYALVIGLFSGRWALLALGQESYGLYGVVGGMVAFVSFLNGLLAMGIGRFYALSVGYARKDPAEGLRRCRAWFTTAVVIHTIIPIVLICIGYPIGVWMVENYLTIPLPKIHLCLWVWRFACISSFASMTAVPLVAMYTAKQEIAELTIYSFITTTFNCLFVYYLVTHKGEWLAVYAAGMCASWILPEIVICIRSYFKYPECRIQMESLNFFSRLRQMFSYVGWLLIGGMSDLLKNQGFAIAINKFLGPIANAAMTVSLSMTNHCTSLANNLNRAFWPAIMNAYGAGELVQARILSFRMSKFATVCTLLFVMPLIIECDYVINVWLANPPPHAGFLFRCAVLSIVFDKLTYCYTVLFHASGRLKFMQVVGGSTTLLVLPVTIYALWCGGDVRVAGLVLASISSLSLLSRVAIGRIVLNLSVREWCCRMLLPALCVVAVSLVVGGLILSAFSASFVRLMLSSGLVAVLMLGMAWACWLSAEEKLYLQSKIALLTKRMDRMLSRG